MLALALLLTAFAQTTPLTFERVERALDSGALDNPADEPAVLFDAVLDAGPGAAWVQVRFADASLPAGSLVSVTSLVDGESQRLTRRQLVDEWGLETAYFNGPAVRVQLVAAPRTRGNRLAVESLAAGRPRPVPLPDPADTICGGDDERVPSSDAAVGRLIISGDVSTAFIVTDAVEGDNRLHVGAGHTLAGNSQGVMQFDVPDSDDFCQPQMPPVAKQFAIDFGSAVFANNGEGDDWAVFACFENPNTGNTTFEEQGAALTLASSVPVKGEVAVTGHGVDGNQGDPGGANAACFCDPKSFAGSRSLTQQVAEGPITFLSGNRLEYFADTCGGSSGSPVALIPGGEVLAVHGQGECAEFSGANIGTTMTHPDLLAAIAGFSPTWTSVGNGLAGINGVPFLTGIGTLSPGAFFELQLSDAIASSSTTLIVGLTRIDAPFKGGVLVPAPDVLVPGIPTGGGDVDVSSTWPAGVPAGVELHFQHWLVDPTAPKGLSASNGLKGVTS